MKTAMILCICSAAAHAEPASSPRYSLDIGSHIRTFGDASAAIVANDALAGTRITLGRRLGTVAAPVRDLELGVFARWVVATVDGTMFQTLQSTITQHALAAGVRVDATLAWRFRAVGQAELGMARTALTITEPGMTVPVDDHGWAPYGTATLGTELALVESRRFRFSVGVDLGYTVTVPVELRARPRDRPDEDRAIATEYASIGSLDTRGWTYSMAFRGGF